MLLKKLQIVSPFLTTEDSFLFLISKFLLCSLKLITKNEGLYYLGIKCSQNLQSVPTSQLFQQSTNKNKNLLKLERPIVMGSKPGVVAQQQTL